MNRGRHNPVAGREDVRRKIKEAMKTCKDRSFEKIKSVASECMKKRWEDPEWRKKMLAVGANGRGRKITGTALQNIRDAVTRREAKKREPKAAT